MLPGNSCPAAVGKTCLLPMYAAEKEEFVAGLLLAGGLFADVLLKLLPAQFLKGLPLLACPLILADLFLHFALQFSELGGERLAPVGDAGFSFHL